jgi:Zn-dependent protease
MRSTIPLGTVVGINASAHWSLIALLIGLFGVLLWQGTDLLLALRSLLLIGLLFLCVLCHEFGHAIAARTFGVRTLDVTLYPIGGIARLERMPAVPRQELIIAAAGPFVNLLLAVGFFLWSLANGNNPGFSISAQSPVSVSLLWLNLALAVFNLLPVFPMDGGRVLRALLAMRMSYQMATRVTVWAAQILAVGFAVVAIFPLPLFRNFNPVLLFIAVFVFFAARQEGNQLPRTPVSDTSATP